MAESGGFPIGRDGTQTPSGKSQPPAFATQQRDPSATPGTGAAQHHRL